MNHFSSCDSPTSLTSTASSHLHLSDLAIPEEGEEPWSKAMPPLGTYQPIRHRLIGNGNQRVAIAIGTTCVPELQTPWETRLGEGWSRCRGHQLRRSPSNLLAAWHQVVPKQARDKLLACTLGSCRHPERHESISDSSSSGGSQKHLGPQEERLEAEDVNCVMKYLKKAEVD